MAQTTPICTISMIQRFLSFTFFSGVVHMSIFTKALVILTAGLIAVPFAADPPDWGAELIFDDFQDMYGDPINRNYTGAIRSFAEKGRYTSGDWGYWYVYEGGTAEVRNPGDVKITEDNIETAFDAEGYMHFKFFIEDNEDYCAIASNILGETDYIDFSKLTAISLRAKGSGFIRVYLKSEYVESKFDWGHLGYEIELSSAWEDINIPTSQLVPALWSPADDSGVTWADVKTGIGAFVIEATADLDGDKMNSEAYIDDIVFKGMIYQDVVDSATGIVTASGKHINHSAFTITGNAISYTIAQPREVSFSLFDMSGHLVGKLSRNAAPSGTHTIALPAALSTGNYVVKMNGLNALQYTVLK